LLIDIYYSNIFKIESKSYEKIKKFKKISVVFAIVLFIITDIFYMPHIIFKIET